MAHCRLGLGVECPGEHFGHHVRWRVEHVLVGGLGCGFSTGLLRMFIIVAFQLRRCRQQPERRVCRGSVIEVAHNASKAGGFCQVDPEAVPASLVSSGHLHRGMAKLFLDMALLDLCA